MANILKLYVTGQTPNSLRAIKNLQALCDSKLSDDFELKVIDILKEPQLAEDDKIIATPTLVKMLPPPIRKVIGDLSNQGQVLLGLDLISRE